MVGAKKEDQEEYAEINVSKLAESLAIDTFNMEVKNVPIDDVYPVELSDDGTGMKVEKELHPRWVNLMFSLRDSYKMLILSYKRK